MKNLQHDRTLFQRVFLTYQSLRCGPASSPTLSALYIKYTLKPLKRQFFRRLMWIPGRASRTHGRRCSEIGRGRYVSRFSHIGILGGISRTEVFQDLYKESIYPKNLFLKDPMKDRSGVLRKDCRQIIESFVQKGIFVKPE